MLIETEVHGNSTLVRVCASRIDAAVAIQFKDFFRQFADAVEGRVVIDLSRVEFLDSSGLGAVVAVKKLLAPQKQLELAGLTPTVAKVFKLTRMDSVFCIHPAADGALTPDTDVA